jgi:hypothetical protein
MTRPTIRKCYGRNPRTGHGVGERHQWPNGWGRGRCNFCGRYLEDLFEKPEAPKLPVGSSAHLERALKSGD